MLPEVDESGEYLHNSTVDPDLCLSALETKTKKRKKEK